MADGSARSIIDASELITFEARGAGKPRYTVTVFTDPDCGYCRKLHGEIDKITELGVRVRYAAYPRSGPGTDSWRKTEMVWCAKDRAAAITAAKLGEPVASPACDSPVARQYALATQMGIRGTPMILLDNGASVGGYLPAALLLERLEKVSAETAALSAGSADAGSKLQTRRQ